jgi:hypothetical protein
MQNNPGLVNYWTCWFHRVQIEDMKRKAEESERASLALVTSISAGY